MLDSDLVSQSIDRAAHVVLVVDDDPATCYATARVLRAAGFQTREAATGFEALRAAPSVSAIVLDVHLPDIDGFEVCRRIRSEPSTALLPIMHVSAAHVADEDNVTGLNAGGDAYLVRPVEPAVLVATLQALIRARMAEDQVRRSEARFRAIYAHAPSGIAIIDSRGRFTDANSAMCQMLGRARDNLVGMELGELAPSEWRALVVGEVLAIDDQSRWKGEFPLLRPDGSVIEIDWEISSRVEPGLRIAIALDASERKLLVQRRQELLEQEQAARMEAEHHSRTKDDFIAVLSHELRTPLNAIVGWVHILNRRGGSPELLKGLHAIDRNVKSQVRIISDILDVSRIASGKLRLQRESCDVAELVKSSVQAVDPSIAEKRLSVSQDLTQVTAPAWIDPARFQQIFWNLLTNAIKFSSLEGEIRIFLACDGQRLTLAVQDFGEGIPPEFLGQIFNRFSQRASPGSRGHGGLGLGLSIVKHLAELHGGRVEAASDGPGKGTLVRVEVPAASAPEATPESDSEFAPSQLGAHEDLVDEQALQGVDVLVVEDNAEASQMLSVVLADRGINVRLAIDYESAVNAARLKWPDVLISDIGLPGRDGYELIQQMRLMAPVEAARLPAVALTAFTRPEDKLRALKAGFDDHLGKPLNPHVLMTTITRLLRRSAVT